jgi:two-component system sensor histidine kinase FlrB
MNQISSMDPKQLEHAFQVFNLASSELCSAYDELRLQAQTLSEELALANGELRRQLAEKAALSQRFALLIEALPGGMVMLSESGEIVEANPTAQRMLGEALTGMRWDGLLRERLLQTEVASEWMRQPAAGEPSLRLSISSRTLPPGAGQVLLLQDVTQAHAQRESAQRSQRLAAMGEMAARLAHRLRTPLATALLYAAQLGQPTLAAPERARFAGKTVDRLRHLERLIEDMLLFVRGAKIGPEPVALSDLLREVYQTIEPHAQACGVQAELFDESGARAVRGDRQALVSALLSLLENAVQACQQGGRIRLAASIVGTQVVFRVADTGAGIPAAAQSRLFEPFFTTRSGGTGLGLAIVRAVAEAHGGKVAASSVPGSGSEFILWLPLVPERPPAAEHAPACGAQAAPAARVQSNETPERAAHEDVATADR